MWFCFPSLEGKPGQAGTEGRGSGGRSVEWGLRQWEQPVSRTFHWHTHPASAFGLESTRGRNRTRLFVLSGKLKVSAMPWGRGLQGGEAMS